jgi:hypothetical protein
MIASLLTSCGRLRILPWLLSRVVIRCVTTEAGPYTAWQHRQPADARAYPDDFAGVIRYVITFVRRARVCRRSGMENATLLS